MALLTSRHGNSTKSKDALPCEIGLISVVPNLAGLPIGIGSDIRFAPEPAIHSAPKTRHSAMPSEPGNVRFSVRCLWQFSTRC